MAEYGWTFQKVYSHTLYQLNNLYLAVQIRKGKRDQRLMDLLRVAPNSEKADYEQFRKSLIPVVVEKRADPVVSDLPGFAVNKR